MPHHPGIHASRIDFHVMVPGHDGQAVCRRRADKEALLKALQVVGEEFGCSESEGRKKGGHDG